MRWKGLLWSARAVLVLAAIAAVATILGAQATGVGFVNLFVALYPPLAILIWLESAARSLSKPGETSRNYLALMPIVMGAIVSLFVSAIILTVHSAGGV